MNTVTNSPALPDYSYLGHLHCMFGYRVIYSDGGTQAPENGGTMDNTVWDTNANRDFDNVTFGGRKDFPTVGRNEVNYVLLAGREHESGETAWDGPDAPTNLLITLKDSGGSAVLYIDTTDTILTASGTQPKWLLGPLSGETDHVYTDVHALYLRFNGMHQVTAGGVPDPQEVPDIITAANNGGSIEVTFV